MKTTAEGNETAQWEARDFPLLEAIVRKEEPANLTATQLQRDLGMGHNDAILGIRALLDAQYIYAVPDEVADEWLPVDYLAIRPLERGRRATGEWPSEDPFEEFLETIEQAIDNEPDEGQRSRLQKLRESINAAGKTVVTGLLLEYLKHRGGLA